MIRPSSGRSSVQERRATRLGIGAWLVGLLCLIAGCSDNAASEPPVARSERSSMASTTTARYTSEGTRPTSSLIANISNAVARFDKPNGTRTGSIASTWNDAPSMLPVVADKGDWLEVRLPSRPNGQVAWIRGSDVTLTETPYRIVINLGTRRLHLLRLGHEILDAPAGVGTTTDPTPSGEYFVALFEQAPSAGYGPFVIVTSDHSDTITDWEQSGDAVVAIHGPLGASAKIGSTGAAISHGCVRLRNKDLARLRPVPAGTPITITT